ncbi:MAG: DUF4080 domain-containing protein [Clostridia bacterium]|nr:DUF4080 domain-containing protein [Clostridia bacterium]
MKILLTTLNTKYVHTNIALKYLYETIREKDVALKEFTINEPLGKILREIVRENADVIAFSVYLWNIEEILKLSENIKKICPEVKIILGGPEVTYQSEKILKENFSVDFVICGEGEETFPKLIDFVEEPDVEKKDFLKYVSYRENNEIHVGEIGIVCDTNKIPRIAEKIAKDYDGRIVYIETVRGCPYNCSYCLSSTIKGIRPFDMERVKAELLILMKAEVRLIKFVDRTFNYDKKRALEIWRFLLENNISSEFHFEISAHLIDDEILEFFDTVPENTFRLEIGVQSTNPETIKAINRNTDFEVITKVTKRIMEKNNITTHLDLIAGLPFEGYERFKQSFNDVYKLRPTELQLGFLKLLSGCQITNEKELYEYKYTSYPPYEILENKFISFEEITKLKNVEEMVDVFYNSGRYKNSLKFAEEKFKTPFEFYFELSVYAEKNGYMERKISAEEWFDVLARFYFENRFEDYADFLENLKKDHFNNFGNKRRRGLFLFK